MVDPGTLSTSSVWGYWERDTLRGTSLQGALVIIPAPCASKKPKGSGIAVVFVSGTSGIYQYMCNLKREACRLNSKQARHDVTTAVAMEAVKSERVTETENIWKRQASDPSLLFHLLIFFHL